MHSLSNRSTRRLKRDGDSRGSGSLARFRTHDPEIRCRYRCLIHPTKVWNASSRSIYIQYCGLWNERSRLGASWCCYPRTRSLLAPGLNVDFYIKATPKELAPVQSACMSLQLAAAHLRDHVVAYYAIPVQVNFFKYVMDGEYE